MAGFGTVLREVVEQKSLSERTFSTRNKPVRLVHSHLKLAKNGSDWSEYVQKWVFSAHSGFFSEQQDFCGKCDMSFSRGRRARHFELLLFSHYFKVGQSLHTGQKGAKRSRWNLFHIKLKHTIVSCLQGGARTNLRLESYLNKNLELKKMFFFMIGRTRGDLWLVSMRYVLTSKLTMCTYKSCRSWT